MRDFVYFSRRRKKSAEGRREEGRRGVGDVGGGGKGSNVPESSRKVYILCRKAGRPELAKLTCAEVRA